MEQIHLAHMPSELAVFAAHFTDVENASFLREQLLAGNTDFEYAFIDASMILSKKHVLAAVWRAMNDYLNDRLKSRNIHSEIVFALSPNNNIGEAFRRFGISDLTKALIVIKVATQPSLTLESVSRHLAACIKGQQAKISDGVFGSATDVARIRKAYKLGPPPKTPKQMANGVSNMQDQGLHGLEVQVLGLMALRGAT